MELAENDPMRLGLYLHFKGGYYRVYEVLERADIPNTQPKRYNVSYQSMENGKKYSRSQENFSDLSPAGGNGLPRFIYQGNVS